MIRIRREERWLRDSSRSSHDGCAFGRRHRAPASLPASLAPDVDPSPAGHPAAQAALGTRYSSGKGTAKVDIALALRWWRKAAEQGQGTAQFHLAVCHDSGRGVRMDADKAVAYAAALLHAQSDVIVF